MYLTVAEEKKIPKHYFIFKSQEYSYDLERERYGRIKQTGFFLKIKKNFYSKKKEEEKQEIPEKIWGKTGKRRKNSWRRRSMEPQQRLP